MNTIHHKPWSSCIWWIIAIILILIGILLFGISQKHSQWNNGLQLIGSISSALGLIFAIIQIIHIRRTSETTAAIVESTLSDVNNYFSYADLSKCEKLIDDIESIARQKSGHALAIKLKELKDNLIDFQKNPELKDTGDLTRWVGIITTDIITCSSSFISQYDFEQTIGHVENVKTKLTEIASTLKYKQYGQRN